MSVVGWFVCRMIRRRHDWATVTSYYNTKEGTDIVHYNWCLDCDKIKILAKSERRIEGEGNVEDTDSK
jgi:hypothetical protein